MKAYRKYFKLIIKIKDNFYVCQSEFKILLDKYIYNLKNTISIKYYMIYIYNGSLEL